VAPGLEASVDSCILYLTNSGREEELVDQLVSLKMQLGLFD
jgi:hypothetical protein